MFNYLKAIFIMTRAHFWQKDRGHHPYIFHPLRVSMNVQDKKAKIVALLHDVLEDSQKYKVSDLKFLDKEQIEALKRLTHRTEDSYDTYITKIKMNRIARMVKIADLNDNMNLNRLPNPSDRDLKRIEKYKKAYSYLMN